METHVVRINKQNLKEELGEAASLIRNGELVAFPTETVYGLGADALNPKASEKIYAAKGRPSDNPLIVHICRVESLEEICSCVPREAYMLAESFWPGPLTMILPKSDRVPDATTGGLSTVAVRMPDHIAALGLIEASGRMIAAPSANVSGRPSPTKAEHVYEDLKGRIPMILDGGEVRVGIESTIVDLSEDKPVILRPGYITAKELSEVIGEVRIDPALEKAGDEPPKAPGMKYRHYAPKAPLVIVKGASRDVTDRICEEIKPLGQKAGVLCADETKDFYKGAFVISLGGICDEETIARHLFDALRRFDEAGVEAIWSESFDTPKLGDALMNRLGKAAGGRVIRV